MNEQTAHMSNASKLFVTLCVVGQSVLYLYDYPIMHGTLSTLRLLCFLYVALRCRSIILPDKFGFMLLTYVGCLFYSTLRGAGNLFTVATIFINTYTLALMIKDSIQSSEDGYKDMMLILAKVFSFYIYVNFIAIVAEGGGGILIKDKYLLGGNYNQMGLTCLSAIYTNAIYYKQWGERKTSLICTCIAACGSPLIVGSMTSTVGLLILCAFLFVPKRLQRIGIITFFVVYVVFQAFTVFSMGDISQNKHVVYFVEQVLHKDMSFTHRASVWVFSLLLILRSPVWGYGTQDMAWYIDKLGGVTTAHNIFLQVMLDGGFVLLVVFLIIIFTTLFRLIRCKGEQNKLLIFGIINAFFMMMMETYPAVIIMNLIMIGNYYVEYIKNNDKLQHNNTPQE